MPTVPVAPLAFLRQNSTNYSVKDVYQMAESFLSLNSLDANSLLVTLGINLPLWCLLAFGLSCFTVLYITQICCAITKRPLYQKLGKQLFLPSFISIMLVTLLPLSIYAMSLSLAQSPPVPQQIFIKNSIYSFLGIIVLLLSLRIFNRKPAQYSSLQPILATVLILLLLVSAATSIVTLFMTVSTISDGNQALTVFCQALAALIATPNNVVNNITPIFPAYQLTSATQFTVTIAQTALTAAELLVLFLPVAYAVGIVWVFLRRNKDDFGRDYYIFAIKHLAKSACISSAIYAAVALYIFFMYHNILFVPAQQMAFGGIFAATAIIPCLLWAVITRSATPLRLKGAVACAIALLLIHYSLLLTYFQLLFPPIQ